MRQLSCIFAIVCIMVAAASVQAAETVRMITVQGKAEKDVMPDQAQVQLTVQAEDRELQKAKMAHDKQLKLLFQIAGEMKIEQKDLKTQHAQVSPQYRYDNGEQYLKGYMVSTSIQMTVRNIDAVGELLERLTGAKFDRIGNVQYVVDDDEGYRDEVLLEALKHAKAKAAKMASALDQEIGKPLQISEGYAQHKPQPVMMERAVAAFAMDSGMGGGIAPPTGMTRITGTVTASFALED